MKNFAEHISQHIGCQVQVNDPGAFLAYQTFVVDGASDKLGTMKSGEKAPYVVLKKPDEFNVTISIHPESAKRLFNKGEEAGMKILGDIAGSTVEQIAEAIVPVSAPVVAIPPSVVGVNKESKKEGTIRIYKEGQAAGSSRKEILARMYVELNMSVPCANTYFQNVKSGLWS